MERINIPKKNEPITLEWGEKITNRSNREVGIQNGQMLASEESLVIVPNYSTEFAIFQISEIFEWANPVDQNDEYLDADPTPVAKGFRLNFQHASADDVDDESEDVLSYMPLDSEDYGPVDLEEKLYAPMQFMSEIDRSDTGAPPIGYAIGIDNYTLEQRVLCMFNSQSGRWELTAPAETMWRFELTGDPSAPTTPYIFSPGDSAYALCLRKEPVGGDIDPNDGMLIEIHDPLNLYSGEFSLSGSTRGYCKFFADMNRWEIITTSPSRSSKFWMKAYSDWVNGSGLDYVIAQRSTSSGSIVDTTQLTVYLPAAGRNDPAVYSGDIILCSYDSEDDIVCDYTANDALYDIKIWHNSAALPDGWVDCHGQALSADKKVTSTNAPDAEEAQCLINVTTYSGATTDEKTIGNTLGYRWHGQTENNHPQHPNHRHTIDATSLSSIAVTTPGDSSGLAINGTIPTFYYTAGVGNLAGETDDIRGHFGPFNSNQDTINIQPSLVTRFIFRYK